jgi:hypothetical protein
MTTATGSIVCETTETSAAGVYSVEIRQTVRSNQDISGLVIPDIQTLDEAKEVGDALIQQFSNAPLPAIEFTAEPLPPHKKT